MNKKTEKNSGFTLIEVLLATVILGMVLALSSSLIIQSLNISLPGSRRMSVKQMAELHLTEIIPYVKNAREDGIENYKIKTREGKKVEYHEEKDKIVIKDEKENKINSFSNISYFDINNENNDYYTIELTKERDEEKRSVNLEITPRYVSEQ